MSRNLSFAAVVIGPLRVKVSPNYTLKKLALPPGEDVFQRLN